MPSIVTVGVPERPKSVPVIVTIEPPALDTVLGDTVPRVGLAP